MKRFALMTMAAAGMLFAGSMTQASDCQYGGGYAGYGYNRSGFSVTIGSPYSVGRTYVSPYTGNTIYRGFNYGVGYSHYNNTTYPGYGSRPPVWHDTSHFDFHPGYYSGHGNHSHYVPAHYDYHRTGHYHH